MSLCRLTGRVLTALSSKKLFKIVSLKTEKEYKILYEVSTRTPFDVGDLMCVVCEKNEDCDYLTFDHFERIELAQDKDTFSGYMFRALRGKAITTKKSDCFFTYIDDYRKKNHPEVKGVIDMISELAELHLNCGATFVLQLLTGVKFKINGSPQPIMKPDAAIEFLKWWQDVVDMKRLRALGIQDEWYHLADLRPCEKKDLYSGDTTPYSFYLQALKNPYAIPTIPLKECKKIDAMTCRLRNKDDKLCGEIVRLINQCLNWGSACCKVNYLEYKTDYDSSLKKTLEEEFSVVFVNCPLYDIMNDVGKGNSQKREEYAYLYHAYEDYLSVLTYFQEAVLDSKVYEVPDIDLSVLDEYQQEAVRSVLENRIAIVTGGAGCGKTMTIGYILRALYKLGLTCCITSFTGKAVIRAKQMSGIGKNAFTMHLLIDSPSPVDFDVVVYEETSMTSLPLFAKFLRKEGVRQARAVFIGDVKQLRPIEWGCLFEAMVHSYCIPMTELKKNHRILTKDGEVDGIIRNATRMRNWKEGEDFYYEETDNFKILCGNEGSVSALFDYIEEYAKTGDCEDITILCPFRKPKENGRVVKHIKNINRGCQKIWNNGNKRVLDPRKKAWYVGERVMVKKNIYEVEIYNGQEGRIVEVSKDGFVVKFSLILMIMTPEEEIELEEIEDPELVRIELKKTVVKGEYTTYSYDKFVTVPFVSTPKKGKGRPSKKSYDSDGGVLWMKAFTLSYAMTVHKAQGSEWKKVVGFMPANANINNPIMCINSVYTEITRAIEEVRIYDRLGKTCEAINKKPSIRHDTLCNEMMHTMERVRMYVEVEDEEIHDMSDSCSYDEEDFY